MTYLRIKNFWSYQNADVWKKARANKSGHKHPAWCKLYVARDLELDALHPMVRLVFYELLRLATITGNVIPNDISTIAKAISTPRQEVVKAIPVLLKGAWLSETRSPRRSREILHHKEIEKEKKEPPIVPQEPPVEKRGNGWVPNLGSYTGCKLVRGESGMAHVFDILGMDRPPRGWPHERPSRQQIASALRLASKPSDAGSTMLAPIGTPKD